MINKNFWNGKRVLVTGHTGFKGSWLVQWLLLLGCHVKGYSLDPNTEPSLFDALELAKEIEHETGDIRNYNQLQKSFKSFKPQIVFHLAAQPLVRRSYKEPRLTYETNVMGTLNVYESVRECNSVRSIVSVTTDKCYENKEWVWGYRESDPMGGYDPYSSSKGCVELLSAAYRNSFFKSKNSDSRQHPIALATARAGNVIGGGDWAEDRLIPDCIRSLQRNEKIIIRNPAATRPWQHVLEPLSGYLLLAQKLWKYPDDYAEGWNFGPGDTGVVPVSTIVEQMIHLWGNGTWAVSDDSGPHEANLLKLDISKATQVLGWKPALTIEEALSLTIDLYRQYYAKTDNLKSVMVKQIDSYMDIH